MIDDLSSCRFFDSEIEKTAIGLLAIYFENLKHNIPLISRNDFYFENSKKCFDKLELMFKSNEAYDVSVLLSLFESEEIKTYFKDCTRYAATAHEFPAILNRIKELSTIRMLSNDVNKLMFDDNLSINELEKVIIAAKMNCNYGSAEEKAQRNLREFKENIGIHKSKIKTGFGTIDAVTGGLRKGTVVHIGARPSTGKTALALNIAKNQKNKKVIIFSLEMSCEMIYERMASSMLMIDYGLFSKEKLSGEQVQEVKSLIARLETDRNLYVYDDIYNIENMAATIVEIKPDLVIIDYIQKVTTTQKILQMRERIEYISGELKHIAGYNKCTIIALSQLTRNGKEAPTMSDLKESGALEADGDYIMLIHRPYVLNKKDPNISPETTELIIDKNKFGNTGKIDMCFKGEYQQFYEMARDISETPGTEEIPF